MGNKKRKKKGKEKGKRKKITPVLLARVYPRARTQACASASAHARRGDPPMRQDRPSAGRPRHAAETHRPGEAPRHAQGAGMPSDVLADPQKRLKQGEINMRNHGKNEDTEKIIYQSLPEPWSSTYRDSLHLLLSLIQWPFR